jgi:hypothetical protein
VWCTWADAGRHGQTGGQVGRPVLCSIDTFPCHEVGQSDETPAIRMRIRGFGSEFRGLGCLDYHKLISISKVTLLRP